MNESILNLVRSLSFGKFESSRGPESDLNNSTLKMHSETIQLPSLTINRFPRYFSETLLYIVDIKENYNLLEDIYETVSNHCGKKICYCLTKYWYTLNVDKCSSSSSAEMCLLVRNVRDKFHFRELGCCISRSFLIGRKAQFDKCCLENIKIIRRYTDKFRRQITLCKIYIFLRFLLYNALRRMNFVYVNRLE